MTAAELRTALKTLLDEDGVRRSDTIMDQSLSEGYTVMALMTQGAEVTHSYVINSSVYYWALPDDFFVPIQVLWNGARLWPARMHDIDELSSTWMSDSAATPLYYWTIGSLGSAAQLWFYPVPAASGTLKLTYAMCPSPFGGDTETPRLPLEFHYGIVWYGYMWELLKERGSLLANKALRALEEFVRHVNECQAYVYRRTPDRDFAMKPWDAEAVRRKLHSFEQMLRQQPVTTQATVQEMAQ